MIKFMRKAIPVLVALIVLLTVFIIVAKLAGQKEQPSGDEPETTALLINTPGKESLPTVSPEPTDPPVETPTPEPQFSAVISPRLEGTGSEDIEISVRENLIEARYPYLKDEDLFSGMKLIVDGENIGYVEGQETGFEPWQLYPVRITDSQGLVKDFTFRFIPKGLNIPLVSIYTEGPVTSRLDYVSGTIYVNGDNTEGFKGKNIDGAGLKIRGRGNASWDMTDKKAYRLKLNEKSSVLGLPTNRDFVLVSNYFDKSLLRNVVAHSLAQQMEYLYYTPTHIEIDFFLNGRYMGVYTIADKIEEAKSKVQVYNGTNPDEPGFMIEIGWDYSKTNVRDKDYFDTDIIIRLFVKEPDIPAANSPEMMYIKNYIKKAEEAMVSGIGYEEYIDVDNMVDWFIIAELTNNTEMAFYRSCYFYKPEGGKITMGPVWDFDMAFGNHQGDIWDYNGWATAEATYHYVNDTWTTYLVKDQKFMDKVKARWLEVRDRLLETASRTIDEQYALVKDSAELNFSRWDIIGQQIGLGNVDYKVYDTYEKQVRFLREFIIKRAAWIDGRLGISN